MSTISYSSDTIHRTRECRHTTTICHSNIPSAAHPLGSHRTDSVTPLQNLQQIYRTGTAQVSGSQVLTRTMQK
uniref:Uncharacterized protein n=1 Tax=Zea mays TaxID=4577 RepID=C4IYQ5_MAIZE|nr:unknown [Zea mays]ACR37079.1 unknown [Zea mays]